MAVKETTQIERSEWNSSEKTDSTFVYEVATLISNLAANAFTGFAKHRQNICK